MFTTNYYIDQPLLKDPWHIERNALTEEECARVLSMVKEKKIANLDKGLTAEKEQTLDIRNSNICFLPRVDETSWLFQKMSEMVNRVNKKFYQYNLTHLESLQFTEYDESYEGFYKKHVDLMFKASNTRKLSFTLQLSNPKNYKGGDLLVHTDKLEIKCDREQGTAIFFPSWLLHEIKPVTEGTRYSLVGWVVGPRFK